MDVALPYCMACGDPNAPSFTTGAPYGPTPPQNRSENDWAMTPRGAVLSALMAAVADASERVEGEASIGMEQLRFAPASAAVAAPLDQLLGWGFTQQATKETTR